jgi:uncharacterized protein
MSKGKWLYGMCLLCVLGCQSTPERHNPVRVLIFSGQNNHAWQETTPVIQKTFNGNACFTVRITDRPDQCTAKELASYNVIVSNWNNYTDGPPAPVADWPVETKEAFLNFIRAGGGYVTIHAGGSSFYDWPEYQQIVASWEKGKTNHGRIHPFQVDNVCPDHPIVHDLKSFWITDELWNSSRLPADCKILLTAFSSPESGGSGHNEPVLVVRSFGKGRCVSLVLGHDKAAMANSGWQSLLRRCAEWAATGKVTVPWPKDIPIREQDLAGR